MNAMRGGPGGPVEKAKNFKGTIQKLVKYLGVYKWSIITVMVFAVASTIFTILGPQKLGEATTELFGGIMRMASGSKEGIDFEKIAGILLYLLGLYGLSALFAYIQGFIMSNVTMKVTYNLRRDINEKIHKLPFRYYDKTTTGEVLSRITNDVDTINQSLSQSLTQIITSVTSLIGILVMMFTINVTMTLIALVVLPVSGVVVGFIVKRSQKHFGAQQANIGHVNAHTEEMYGNHVLMKAFNGEVEAAKTFKSHNEKLYSAAWKANFFSGMMMPLMMFIGNLGYVVICIVGGSLAVEKIITVGDIQAFIQYVRQFNQPIQQVATISNVLQQTTAAAERVFEFLEEEEEAPDVANPIGIENIDCCVEFKNVSFGYSEDKTIINNFSAKVQRGQKVAIVGPTGAGKTTMVKLLMRFYDVNSGAILIDGHDIREFARNDLRSLFGMVLQDTWLYNGTIADNIRYGKQDATDEEVMSAAVAAQVDHFVHTLPDGYHMILNEEADNVSGGQKQLLTIARAILADPEILILDEATSSVDTRTELLIQKAMDNLMKGRTSFVIAHRLSTIRNADLILVMKDGDIIEQGTHSELLSANGFYANLYNSQFENVS